MSIEFHCGNCNQPFKVPDDYAGKKAKCKTCGQVVAVPFPAEVRRQPELPPLQQSSDLDGLLGAAVADQHSMTPLTPVTRRQSNSGISPAVWIAIGGGGAALLVLAMMMAVMILAGGSRKSASSGDATDQASETGSETSTPSAPDSDAAPEDAPPNVVWGEIEPGYKLAIPDPGFLGTYAFSPPPQPYLAAGTNVFDLEAGTRVARIREKLEGVERCALSPNGKLFAKADKKLGGKIDLVVCETGKLAHEYIIPPFAGTGRPHRSQQDDVDETGPRASKDIRIDWLEFIDDHTLLSVASSHFEGAAFVWDVGTDELISPFRMPAAHGERCAVSPDRKYMAAPQGETFVIRELPEGEIVTTMQTPPTVDEVRFSMTGCKGVAFSSDGTELAACFRSKNMLRVVCWDIQSELIFDQPRIRLASTGNVGVGAIQWVPDKSGWLLDGRHLLDRQSKRLVWQLEHLYDRLGCRFRTTESLLVNRSGGGAPELVRMTFPWTEIRGALALIDSDEGVLLRPGGAATIQVELGTLRYSQPQQTKKELTRVLTERLAIDDVGVAPDQPMRLVAFYTEKAGETLKVVEEGFSPFEVHDTGKTVEETKAQLELKWVDQAGNVVWEREITRATDRYGDEEKLTSANLRKDMFRDVLGVLSGVRIPYLIPADPDVAALPVISKVRR